ncbi:MAG: hypothetical protein JEZ03_07910 [Bacteroidales bacterium]|nr:hypothetical protein [Bacteroidales bacterium]
MNTNYYCPKCEGRVNMGNNIILIMTMENGKRSITFLHTELGNYESQVDPNISIKAGDRVEFLCPLCHSNIEYHKEDTSLVHLVRVDELKNKSKVILSKIYGEYATYHIEGDQVKSYGEHALRYSDPEWYLKNNIK